MVREQPPAGDGAGDWVSGRHVPLVPGLEGAAVSAIEASELSCTLAASSAVVVDLDFSRRYVQGHIPGAWFATRARLHDAFAKVWMVWRELCPAGMTPNRPSIMERMAVPG